MDFYKWILMSLFCEGCSVTLQNVLILFNIGISIKSKKNTMSYDYFLQTISQKFSAIHQTWNITDNYKEGYHLLLEAQGYQHSEL